jgi:predicted nuclease with TOPRIM domain
MENRENNNSNHELEKDVKNLKEDIRHEKSEIEHEEKEIQHEKKEVEYLEKRVAELEAEIKSKDECVENIFVNAEKHQWEKNEISFEEVVHLGFTHVNPDSKYSITYSGGIKEKPEGSLYEGEKVRTKNLMRFNVTQANKS